MQLQDVYGMKLPGAAAARESATSHSLRRSYRTPLRVALAGLVLGLAQMASHGAQLSVLAAQYRADVPFPQFEALWQKAATATSTNVKAAPSGGSVHVYLRNAGAQPVTIEDVLLEGVSLTQAIAITTERKFKKHLYASSIYFSKLPPAERQRLMDLGEPIWWRVDPKTLEPGAVAEVLVRLRRDPAKPVAHLPTETGWRGLAGDQRPDCQRVGPPRRRVFFAQPGYGLAVFRRAGEGRAPEGSARRAGRHLRLHDRGRRTVATLSRCPPPARNAFAPASLHCFQAVYSDGATAIATARAFPADFVYGVWGAKRAQGNDPSVGRAFVQEMAAHNVNLQMPGVGSPAVATFYKSDEGRALLAKLGVRRVVDSVGKAGDRLSYAYYLADEPDAADSRVPGVPGGHQVGCLGQGLVDWGHELRRQDRATPNMLNVDSTYVPNNYRIYGQLPDLFAADPYYQPRLREAYAKAPQRVPLFNKATYVHAVSSICKSSSEPRPLHIMLYGNRYEKGEDKFRGPTPPEKRIEAFYAIAAGAKGLSYWWYLPSKPAVGLGAAEPGARALWREVGLIGAELRTAAPLITRSSPMSLPVTATPKVWVKALAVGLDALLLVVVNDDYTNDREGRRSTRW